MTVDELIARLQEMSGAGDGDLQVYYDVDSGYSAYPVEVVEWHDSGPGEGGPFVLLG